MHILSSLFSFNLPCFLSLGYSCLPWQNLFAGDEEMRSKIFIGFTYLFPAHSLFFIRICILLPF